MDFTIIKLVMFSMLFLIVLSILSIRYFLKNIDNKIENLSIEIRSIGKGE